MMPLLLSLGEQLRKTIKDITKLSRGHQRGKKANSLKNVCVLHHPVEKKMCILIFAFLFSFCPYKHFEIDL